MGFQIVGLRPEPFAPLFALPELALRERSARRVVVDAKPGFPCRVSLADAEVGETVLLLPFAHHDVNSPYRASGPIYVRQGVEAARPAVDEIPLMLRHRLLSLRAYDSDAMLVAGEVVQGSELDAAIRTFLGTPAVSYLHVHNARPGCYNCRVERVA